MKIQITKKEFKEKEPVYNDCYIFEYINKESQLVYPMIYNDIIANKKIEDFEINNFNYILRENYKENVQTLIEPLTLTKKVPPEILSKFYVNAYTLDSPFYKFLNRDLMKSCGKKYSSFIKILYKGMKEYSCKDLKLRLYRGGTISEKELNKIKEVLESKESKESKERKESKENKESKESKEGK